MWLHVEGEPRPGKVIPTFDREGEQIATMEETRKARPILICKRLKGGEELEGEALGGEGVQMELLHERLGHTSQSGMERLNREQTVRGFEEGVKGNFGICRGCRMGKSSEKSHPRKDPSHRAIEPLELLHTNIARVFKPNAIEEGSQYNPLIIDDFNRKSWTILVRQKSDTKVVSLHEFHVSVDGIEH